MWRWGGCSGEAKGLVKSALDGPLFRETTDQLAARAIRVRAGALVDATVVAPANRRDQEADGSGHRSRKAIHGDKAHVGADADTGSGRRAGGAPGQIPMTARPPDGPDAAFPVVRASLPARCLPFAPGQNQGRNL